MTRAEQKRKERAHWKSQGWVRFECWIRPEWALRVKALIEKLSRATI
jgi:hypothetical protein